MQGVWGNVIDFELWKWKRWFMVFLFMGMFAWY